MMLLLKLSLAVLLFCNVAAFQTPSKLLFKSVIKPIDRINALFSLEKSSIQVLEEISGKYSRLVNVDSPEANAEVESLKETVEKYKTFIEVKKLMVKIRSMYKNEVSETRRAKQLKSFIDLYKGKLQLEEILKQKIGLPFSKATDATPLALQTLYKLDSEIALLEGNLETVSLQLPSGKRTSDERFA
jgi:hypothetical protein